MSGYLFSVHVRQAYTQIKKRKWWDFFGKEEHITKFHFVRKAMKLSQSEGDALFELHHQDPLRTLFLKAFAGGSLGDLRDIQLEYDTFDSDYIKTEEVTENGSLEVIGDIFNSARLKEQEKT